MPTNAERIRPSIGLARVGNSSGAWYLEPTSVGGLPTELDDSGNEQRPPQIRSVTCATLRLAKLVSTSAAAAPV
jgi:hypothetical protein